MRKSLTERLIKNPGARIGQMSVGSKIALGILGLIILLAIFGPLLTPYGPQETGLPSSRGYDPSLGPVVGPSADFWFGTDAIGRDIFTRVVFGARKSLTIGLCATGLALVLAAVLGSIAATANKVVAEVLMRILDIIMSFPGIALAAAFVAAFSKTADGQPIPRLPVLIFAIAFLYVPQITRVVRANVLAQYGEDYVSASRVVGASTWWIIMKHVARNCIAPVLVFATVLVADAIVFEASLSFINAGITPPEPSWGNILADGKQLLLSGRWWPTFFPGLFILITVLCLNVLSEGMTDAMVAPAARKPAKIVDPNEAQTLAVTDDAVATQDTVAENAEPDLKLDPGAYEMVADVTGAGAAGLDTTAPKAIVGGSMELLGKRLTQLREVELARTDRLIYNPVDSPAPLLEVRDLCIAFPGAHGDVNIVDHVSYSVRPGETMGLVGESGCGKSITSLAIMGLLPPTARIQGEIIFDGQDLLRMSPQQRNELRGKGMSMIYQDALSSLNPSMLIKNQMAQLTKRGGTRSAEELLHLVGLDPKRTLASYPHELSGGQRQRVLIAMGLTRDPKLVIADEPTTALDVTVQQQVVDLLNELREKLGFAMVFVSHDLALVAQLAHRITVMYAGQVVETGTTTELMSDPRHEYTRGLLGAVLSIEDGGERLHQIPGVVPSPRDFVPGDRFSPRSSHPEIGRETKPVMSYVPGTQHSYATHPELEEARYGN